MKMAVSIGWALTHYILVAKVTSTADLLVVQEVLVVIGPALLWAQLLLLICVLITVEFGRSFIGVLITFATVDLLSAVSPANKFNHNNYKT